MTMVGLLLEIPEDETDENYVEIPCQGVVVRSKVVEGAYEAAILFQDLEEVARDLIKAYVDRHLKAAAD